MIFNNYYFLLPIFSFLFSFLFTKLLIDFFKKINIFQPIRLDLKVDHNAKIKTPSIGGLAIIMSVIINMFFFL